MQKIAIFGIGAIGSVTAFCLSERNVISYYNRSAKSRIEIEYNGERFRRAIRLADAEQTAPPGWLIICLKAYHYPGAMERLRQLIGPRTKIAVIRNGLRLRAPLLPYATPENILECMIDCPTQLVEAGHYLQLREPVLTVPAGTLAEAFSQLILPEKIKIRPVKGFLTEKWRKLIESSALGGLMVMHDKEVSLFRQIEMKKLYAQAIAEGILVATADGANLQPDYKQAMLTKLTDYPSTKSSSMLMDRRSGNPLEIEAKSGVISHLGKQYGIAVPVHDCITNWCRAWNKDRNL